MKTSKLGLQAIEQDFFSKDPTNLCVFFRTKLNMQSDVYRHKYAA